MIYTYGKGLVGPHPKDADPKRYQLMGVAAAPRIPDFTQPTGIPVPPDEDQGSSSSCTWQAFAYYFWQLTGIQLSRQDGYSRTHLPGGGGYLIDPFRAMMAGAKGGYNNTDGTGCYNRDQNPDPNPQTEQNMTLIVNLPNQQRRVFQVSYWYIPYNDINAVAQAIIDYKGIVIGVNGNNADWKDAEHPKPPQPGTVQWSHALYCRDLALYNLEEQVVAKSSWCNYVKQHFISKSYFTSGNVFSPIVMQVKELDFMVYSINLKGKIGLMEVTDRTISGTFAANPDELKVLEKVYSVPGKVLNFLLN